MTGRLLLLALVLTGCGGGGGGATVSTPGRLLAADLEFAVSANESELVVSLAELAGSPPALLQVAIELPAALHVAPDNALRKSQVLPTLRGDMVEGRYLIVCGDDQNLSAAPLQNGELFRLRLIAAAPRQVGSHRVILRDLLAAQSNSAQAPVENAPTEALVTVR